MPDWQLPRPTERIRFRHYIPSDVGLVAELFDDDQARDFYPTMGTPEAHSSWIEWSRSSYRDHGFGLWVIEEINSGIALGDCGLTYQAVAGEQRIEVGYHLAAANRGMGYATESATACVLYAFDELGAESVCSIVDPHNGPSIAVASRVHASQSSFVNAQGNTMLLFTTGQGAG